MRSSLEVQAVVDFRTDQRLSRGTRAFLKALNTPAPPELEKLPALEARKVLETAQASVAVDISGIDESEKTITTDGIKIVLNIVRPRCQQEVAGVHVHPRRRLGARRLPNAPACRPRSRRGIGLLRGLRQLHPHSRGGVSAADQ